MPLFLAGIAPEITTKSRPTRQRFQRRLVANLRDAIESGGMSATITDRWSRLLVDASDAAAGERVASVFGIIAVWRVEGRVAADLPEITRVGEALFKDRVRGRAYAVRARRAGRHAFRSHDIEVQLGAALNAYGRVDLTNPDVTVHVEVREHEAFLYGGRIPGVGGLPLGIEGKAVSLLSGGFDSPVAAWMMLKRGISLDYVFCNLAGDAYERSVVSIAKILADAWSYGDTPAMHVVDFVPVVAEMERVVDERYWQVVLKRLMYRAAAAIARKLHAHAIVTGEAVGQVSSQTLPNLRAIDDAVSLPVFRPVLGFDKNEIIERARRVGTEALSAHVQEYCALVRKRPVTNATPEAARAQESRMDLHVLDAAVGDARVLDLRALADADLVAPYLFAAEIPDAARVIDCRPPGAFAAWHYEGATQWDVADLATRFKELDRKGTYVLYCGVGVLSAHVAEMMQAAGYDAYSFRGGVCALQRYAARSRYGPEAAVDA
ncbi:MAG TPA: tRNA uracil 4-sulfurtransferase ThiI [Gemmatimonadales bacterium]